MEESQIISIFCQTLATFCKHIQTSSEILKESIERRPIPLESASSTFIQCLNRRVSSASSDLNLLESMAFGTVSFEELLGHCNELYKKNQNDLIELEDRLKSFGYNPADFDDDEHEDEAIGLTTPIARDSKLFGAEDGFDFLSYSCEPKSIMKRLEEDTLFQKSLNLQNMGLSDACLATLASEDKGEIGSPDVISLRKPIDYDDYEMDGGKMLNQPTAEVLGELEDITNSVEGVGEPVIKISKDEYDSVPSYMKTLAPWEDLEAAVGKMNSHLRRQEKQKDGNLFYQDELATLGLGPKVRSYLLLLLRMNRLVVETVGGSIVYRVL